MSGYISLVHNYYLAVLIPAGPEPLASLCRFYLSKGTNTLWKTCGILAMIEMLILGLPEAGYFK